MAPINWRHTYKPRISIGGVVYLPPTPLMESGESFTKQFKITKVPLQDGVIISGQTVGALTVTFNGIIAENSVEAILHEKRLLQLYLIETAQSFTFWRYYDLVRQNFRWYANCVCNNLTFSSNSRDPKSGKLAYSFTLLVPDGKLHETVVTTGETPDINRARGGSLLGPGDKHGVDPGNETAPGTKKYLYGPIIVKLETDGLFIIENAAGDIVATIDDNGNVQSIGFIEQVDSISVP